MIKKEAEVKILINDKESEQKLKKLEEKAAELRKKFEEAFRKGDTKGIKQITRELQRTGKEIENTKTKIQRVNSALKSLDKATPKDLLNVIKLINSELNSGRVQRGTKEWDAYVAKLKEVKAELAKVKREMQPDDNRSFFDKIKDGINDWGTSAAAATAAFAGVVMSGKAAVQAYADMEAEEANVRKFTGMTAEEVAALNEEFKKMDTRTSREELNQLAQQAGRLGKTSQEDVLGFVRAADKINVALDDLGDDATLTLSKLTGIFGDEKRFGTEQSLLKVGSVINELSQNCSASAPYLAEFSSRLGGIAAQSNMTISQVMAFGAVLDTNNMNVEASSTAVGQLITSMYQEPAKIAKAAGMDVEKFSKLVKTDMNGALIALLEQLNRFGGMESLASVFDAMGTDGARAIPVLTALAGHVDTLKWQQEQANIAFKEGTSVTKEFNVQNNTVQAQLDKAKKGFNEMAVALGEKLLPVMSYCISGSSLLMRVISQIIDFIISYRKELLVLVGVFATYYAGVVLSKAATIAHSVAVAANTAVTKTAAAIQSAYNTVVGMGRVVVIAFTYGLEGARRAFTALNASMKANAFGVALATVAALSAAIVAAVRKITEFSRKMSEARQTANRIREEAIINMGEEKVKIDLLVAAAKNETLSLEERQKAINQLNAIIPNYNAHLDATTGKYIASKQALDAYLQSLTRQYELEGAKAKLAEIGKEKADATLKQRQAQQNYDRSRGDRPKNLMVGTYTTSWGMVGNSFDDAAAQLKSQLDAANRALAIINAKEKSVLDAYGVALQKDAANNADNTTTTTTTTTVGTPVSFGGSPSRSSGGGSSSHGETAQEQQARKAKEALKKDLDERESLYLQAEAENLTLYITGQQSYADYLAKKKELEEQYTDDIIKIHEAHNKIDIAAYGQALKSKADLMKKQQDDERKRKLDDVEAEHKENTDAATAAYFDPSSAVFQNKKALNQLLLQEDLRYLIEKRDLYIKDSEEWTEIDREYQERLRQDQLDKQQELAEAIEKYREQYGDAGRAAAYNAEIEMLDLLHKEGIIKEEEYQQALKKIRAKYRTADMSESFQKFDKIFSKLVELMPDKMSSISKAYTEWLDGLSEEERAKLSEGFEKIINNIGGIMSNFSSYWNAQRDIDVAKIEKRYDREIAAAGNNSKKKKKLEEQKEADIAKVKKKYNDRAMKMEIAQAIAQTAANALGAYGAMVKIPVVGPALAAAAAATALAVGMIQVATIKKQHEAQAVGYYEGGFTSRDPNNRREVGVVHANEFVANHEAVANPALSPLLRLIDTAQRNNTVGSLTAADVSNALGQGSGVSARGEAATAGTDSALRRSLAVVADTNTATKEAVNRLSDALEDGIEAKVILDGEDGFHKKYKHFLKLQNNPKR